MKPVRLSCIAAFAALLASATPAWSVPAADAIAVRTAIDELLDSSYPQLEALYRDLHARPELGSQENRTAALLAQRMRGLGFEVTEGVGGTGIAAVYRNGPGPVVLVRTELDALPLEEKTALPYASRARQVYDGKETFVFHGCGHDIHMAWWVGTAEVLLALKDRWQGTLLFVGQPAEEQLSGARSMLDDGLFSRFPMPDFGFAAHVGAGPAGEVTVKQGVVSSNADAYTITFHGRGAHGAMPEHSIDPILEAVHFANDVQTVISRRKDPKKFGVVTIGAFNAGQTGNVIPDQAVLKLSLRSFDPDVRSLLSEGVTRTARAAAQSAGAPPPDIDHSSGVSTVVNDSALAESMATMLTGALGADRVKLVPEIMPGTSASEDYSEFVTAGMKKSVFFAIGGADPAQVAAAASGGAAVPVNHSPYFAPLPEPSIRTGVEVLALAVMNVAR